MSNSGEVAEVEPDADIVYFSSSYYKEAIKLNPQDIKQKMILARCIATACKNSTETVSERQILSKPMQDKLRYYTNLCEENIIQIISNIETRDRSFNNANKNITEINDQTLDNLSDDIRTIFVYFYVIEKKLPNKLMLLNKLNDKAELYMDEDLSIQKLVRNKLVKYHHIPAYNRYLIMEHPERVYNRTMYLRTMEEYRLQGRNFIYIEMRKLMTATNPTYYVGLALIPHANQLEKFLARDLSEWGAAKWLQLRVLPNVPPDSVVVLYEREKNCNKLTPISRRTALMAWLDNNHISYGKNPHTAEVYALYKAHESKTKVKHPHDHIYSKAGVDVIYCSKKWSSLNCFKVAWDEINIKYEHYSRNKLTMELFKEEIIKATEWMTDNIGEVENSLIKAEKKMITEDAEMEMIIENMMEMINDGDLKMSEFPEELCGDKTQHFETHICDVILNTPH